MLCSLFGFLFYICLTNAHRYLYLTCSIGCFHFMITFVFNLFYSVFITVDEFIKNTNFFLLIVNLNQLHKFYFTFFCNSLHYICCNILPIFKIVMYAI